MRHAALDAAEVFVDVVSAVRGPDEGLVVGEGELSGLLEDLCPLLRQPLRFCRTRFKLIATLSSRSLVFLF